MGAAAWHPDLPSCQPGWGHTVSPTTAHPSPLGPANSGRTLSALNPCCSLPGSGAGRVVLPSPARTDAPRLAPGASLGGRTTLPSSSSCRSRAEVRHFVLISPSKPMKQKFPHGKPLIFECARMCWKPSQWKIPNQPHSRLANLVKPLTREHLSAAVVPALLSGWKSCGMHRAEAAALASPHNWGGRGRCSLVSCCASFAPLFLLKRICPGGFTPQCWAMQAVPEPGCSALHSALTQQSVAALIPSGALLVLPHHSWPANSPPHPHSQSPTASPHARSSHCLTCPLPAATTKPQSPEKPRKVWKKRVPHRTLPPAPWQEPMPLPAVPAGAVPATGTHSPTQSPADHQPLSVTLMPQGWM